MNIEEYISSGILESYALGECTEEECVTIARYLNQYPQLRNELNLIEDTIERFAFTISIDPPASVKEQLRAKIKSLKITNEAKVIVMTPQPFWRYATAASIAIALISSYMAFQYRQLWKEDSNALAQIKSENSRIAEEYNVVNQKLDKIQGDLSVIESTAFTKVTLNGTANNTTALASVYWNSSTKEVFLSVQQLKSISKDNQFQLWAIVDGKPVDVGVFDFDFSGLLKMKNIDGASAFAVTVEPRGGKATPTMEAMQVIGNVVKDHS